MIDVETAFDRGAGHYDLLVSLNPGYHTHLRSAASELVRRIGPRPAGHALVDLACGSGASTRAVVDTAQPGSTVVGVDLSGGMLAEARRKKWPQGVRFEQGRAGDLDVAALGEGVWDGVFASYLFRNVPEIERDTAVAETHRLLKPGGWLVAQEYSVGGSRRAAAVWDAVTWGVILPLGILIDRNPALYRYLWRSVHDFDSTSRFMQRLADAGFVDVAVRTVPGWQHGILHTFVARKAVQ